MDPHDQPPEETRAAPRPQAGSRTTVCGDTAICDQDLPLMNIRPARFAWAGEEASAQAEYVIIERLAEGAHGALWLVEQTATRRQVVAKSLHPEEPAGGPEFLYEALVTGGLDHPNIVQVHDLVRDQTGTVYLVMQHVAGRCWADGLGAGDQDDDLHILLAVASAVAHAHEREVVHRDLKPANVMIGAFGEVQVVDWGVAVRLSDLPRTGAAAVADRRWVAGTPVYMAPEMACGDPRAIGPASDIYLLGAVLFEIATGLPPHPGETSARCIEHAAANLIRPVKQRGELLSIARRAMASEPEARYADVEEFRRALIDYLGHSRSVLLARRAQVALDRAMLSGDYGLFNRAMFRFEEAVSLWPQNEQARRGTSLSRQAYANAALSRGDLDLARNLLREHDPAHAALRARLEDLERRRTHRSEATRHLVSLQRLREADEDRRWKTVYRFADAAGAVVDDWLVHQARVERQGDELRVEAAEPGLLIYNHPLPGDVRLSFTCRVESDNPSDLSCFLAGSDAVAADNVFLTGYEFKYGGFSNTQTRLYRRGTILFDENDSPLEPGRDYRVVASRVGARLRLEVDGRTVWDVVDPEPLAGLDSNRLGLFGFRGTYVYRDLTVEWLRGHEQVDLLELAERQMALGHFATAQDLLFSASDVAPDEQTRAEARRRLRDVERLRRWERQVPEVERRLRRHWPDAEVVFDRLGLSVNLSGLGINDLAPLQGMPLRRLDLRGNQITDLWPLADCPLVRLDISANPVRDLTPLRGMELAELYADRCRIRELEPLADCPLVELSVSANRVTSLAPLQGMPLRQLVVGYNRVTDLAPLAGAAIDRLGVMGNRELASLAPLQGMPLVQFDCSRTAVSDLGPLAGAPLHLLHFGQTPVSDLAPLAKMPLRYLSLEYCRVEDLTPLTGMDLKHMEASGNRISDITPLSGMRAMAISIASNRLETLAPLDRQPPARHLICFDNPLDPAYLRQLLAQDNLAVGVREGLRLSLAIAEADPEGLRALADVHHDRRWYVLQTHLPIHAARKLQRQMGLRFACPVDAELMATLRGLCMHGVAWERNHDILLGLRPGSQTWEDGSPVRWNDFPDGRLPHCEEEVPGAVICRGDGKWHVTQDANRLVAVVLEWDR